MTTTNISDTEVREFIYLDKVAVNSLFASMYMAVPQAISQVAEEHEEKEVSSSVDGGIDLPSLLKFGLSATSTDRKGERGLSEVDKNITDQYRFSILIEALENSEDIDVYDINEGADVSGIQTGDLVKISGECRTDPLYPLANAVQLFMTATSSIPTGNSFFTSLLESQSDKGEFENVIDLVYNGRVGMKVVPEDTSDRFGLVINEKDTWIDPQQEFNTANQYTILGRVQEQVPENEVWDLLEIFRVLSSVSTNEEVMDLRIEIIGKLMQKLEESAEDSDTASIIPEIDPDDFIIDGPATIINPIAIYW
ncbi:hypothetical protein [Natrinema sp. 1APR25-10V2]|uniref:DUF6414 family protein n=1 Tax=Natrinema sp. 1APR25-10V2 TaxID=2951081 RepID=UPI002876880B|nr:hypothetical protein [Natrinema sp. 1APR25-10V2]MDS0475269.1 hypothetical protein [Natrinema sp. 1APR25-10V2]